jgi:EpsI family protein
MSNKNFIVAVSILIIVSVVGFISYLPTRFDKATKVLMADFPMKIGEWQATDIPLTDRDYEILETKNLIMRDYKNTKGDSVYLYIVYSENNRKVTHPPELCLTGGGFTIVDKSSIQLTNNIRGVKLLMEKGDARELVVYWFRAGSLNTDSYVKQQLKVVFDLLRGKRTSCALIRLSTAIKENGEEALGLIKEFCAQIEPLLARYVP